MAEDFTFNQSFRDSRAVDGKERFASSRAKIVNCARDEFFAGSASASDEDGGSAGSYHLNQMKNLLHFFGGANQLAQRAAIAQLPPSDLKLCPCP